MQRLKWFSESSLVSDTGPMLERIRLSVTLSTGGWLGGKVFAYLASRDFILLSNERHLPPILTARVSSSGPIWKEEHCPLLFLAKSLSSILSVKSWDKNLLPQKGRESTQLFLCGILPSKRAFSSNKNSSNWLPLLSSSYAHLFLHPDSLLLSLFSFFPLSTGCLLHF